MAYTMKNCGTVSGSWFTNQTYAQGTQNETYATSETLGKNGAYDDVTAWITAIELFVNGGSAIVAMKPQASADAFVASGGRWCSLYEIASVIGYLTPLDKGGLMAKLIPSAVNDANFGLRITDGTIEMTASGGGSASGSFGVFPMYNFGFAIPQHAMVYNAKWRMYGYASMRYTTKWYGKVHLDAVELTLYYTTRSGILMKQARRV